MKASQEILLNHFSEPKTRNESEQYLMKYWLSEEEWLQNWKLIQDQIFDPESSQLPDMMFREGFSLLPLLGGVIFTQEDFQALQNCMAKVGDTSFVIIENAHTKPQIPLGNGKFTYHPDLKFTFPADITWEEMMGGGGISFELFEMSYKEFFVFGDSGRWGKYVANEFWDRSLDPAGTPLDIIGYTKENSEIFKTDFYISTEDKVTVREWLPQNYIDRVEPWIL